MEFRIDRGVWGEAVAQAARALPARSPMPVLGGLLLEAEGDRLRVAGFDYEASSRIDVPAEVVRPGRALVLGRRLADICRVLPEGPVVCVLEGTRFSVEGGGARFGLSVLPLDEYPALPALPAFRGEVDAAAFAAAVSQVAVAAGRDDTLPVLTGIRIGLDGGTMTLGATDRYRYAIRELEWKPSEAAVPGADAVDVVVPSRRLAETARALAKAGTVRIFLGERGGGSGGVLGIEGDGIRTTVRLLDGRLPRHDTLFAMETTATAEIGRAALTEAVKRVGVVAERDSPLRLDFAEGSVLLQAGYEDDVASQRVPATLTGAETMTVAFNPGYLLDAVSSFESETVRCELLGPGQRALLSDERGTHRHLLMSMKALL
ncbi:DNA polymerase III subunit beta [Streptomyces sp. 150FB]|uniref:DNA polymerase III subunit beta n=1 Tax=Streptomyces sp. 150FB TaxID=1576605 RepID=UPI0005891A59|nr:DNA polymerase III subunit beta [Streptomyces sp. 150FB]KIF75325.1 DNA polymerase III subunit beta [Streptomyces sp. 150FB]